MPKDTNTIYTRDIAADIVELFEDVLDKYNITVPSPEDSERDPDNAAKLYGSVYYDLVDTIESIISETLQDKTLPDTQIIEGVFSGN